MKKFFTIACLMCILAIAPADISATPEKYREMIALVNKELNLPQTFNEGTTMTKFDVNDNTEIEMSFVMDMLTDDTDTTSTEFIEAFRESFLGTLGKGSDIGQMINMLGLPLRIKVYSPGGILKVNEKFLPSEL